MEHWGPLPCSQEFTTGFHPVPDTVHTLIDYLIFISLSSFQLRYGPPAGIFHSGVPHTQVTHSTSGIRFHITAQPLHGAGYSLWAYSLHARIYFSSSCYYCLLRPNILLNTLYSNTLYSTILYLRPSAVTDRLAFWPYSTLCHNNPSTGK
jgi:hypothetical protein